MQQKKFWLFQERPSASSRTGTFCAGVAMGITTSLLLSWARAPVRFKLKLLVLCRNCTSWWWLNFYILMMSRTGCQHTGISLPPPLSSPLLRSWLPDFCEALRSWCWPEEGIVLKALQGCLWAVCIAQTSCSLQAQRYFQAWCACPVSSAVLGL